MPAIPSTRRSSRRSDSRPLLRTLSPVPIDDDDDDDDDETEAVECHRVSGPRHGTDGRRTTSLTTRLLVALFSFLVLGLAVATPGVMLPHLEKYYGLDDARASLVFLAAPLGYLVGAALNAPLHRRAGRRAVAWLAPACQAVFALPAVVIAAAGVARQGGFVLFLAATAVGGVGNGMVDGSWSAWAGGLGEEEGGMGTNVAQGLLHGAFSLGAGLGPFLAAWIVSVLGAPWWVWYLVLLGAFVVQGVVLVLAFRFEDGTRYRDGLLRAERDARIERRRWRRMRENQAQVQVQASATEKGILGYSVTWICALYFLVYVGTESAISGWVVTFMHRERRASLFLASLSSSGFWIGMTAGRLLLGFATDRTDVRRATSAYLVAAIISQTVMLATGDHTAVAVAAVAATGFFLGPLFPSGIVLTAELLPKRLLVGAVSLVESVGQLGAALLPFALGWLSQWLGIRVFEGFIVAMLTATLLVWLAFPKPAVSPVPAVGVGGRSG